jgi:thioredoxin 1
MFRALESLVVIAIVSTLVAACSDSGVKGLVQETNKPPISTPSLEPSEDTEEPEANTPPSKAPTPKPTNPSEEPAEVIPSAPGSYIDLANYLSSIENYRGSKVVLFFNASWCSTCKVARENFESTQNRIPEGLTLVVVDFDNSTELKKRYGVTYQHTFVQIDDSGKELQKWSGSVSFSEIAAQVSS